MGFDAEQFEALAEGLVGYSADVHSEDLPAVAEVLLEVEDAVGGLVGAADDPPGS